MKQQVYEQELKRIQRELSAIQDRLWRLLNGDASKQREAANS